MSYQVKLIVKGTKCLYPVRELTVSSDKRVIIGRTIWDQDRNNAYFESAMLSKYHGLLSADSKGLYYKDTFSKHGSSVNDIVCIREEKYYLKDGDQLRLIENAENPLVLTVKVVDEPNESVFAADDKYIGKEEEEADKTAECEEEIKESDEESVKSVADDVDESTDNEPPEEVPIKSNFHDPECEIVFYDPSHESHEISEGEEDDDYNDEIQSEESENEMSSESESESDTSNLEEEVFNLDENVTKEELEFDDEPKKKLSVWKLAEDTDDVGDLDVREVIEKFSDYYKDAEKDVNELDGKSWSTDREELNKEEAGNNRSLKRKREESQLDDETPVKRTNRTTSFIRDSLIFLAGGVAMFAGLVGVSTIL